MTSVTIGRPEHQPEDVDVIGRRWRTGVLLLILADAAFVAALVFSYFYLRGLNTEKAWLAKGQATAAIWVGWAVAAGAVLSVVIYRWAQTRLSAGNTRRFVTGALLATLVLVADAAGQVVQLVAFPFSVSASAYSSAAYTLAGANLFHLLLTIFIGLAMWNRGRLGLYSGADSWQPKVVALWWTWIAAAAVLGAFATSFIASPNV